ncbi:unnamed protein product [Trichogramma brassicae]|uniref:EGF-like domain-containing protein n=1 Tax=Trichogramma brassicae TaxID=86971 RepID=A0A6H5HU50_9HYME|nr:unnamed protein product [Trichogramma brassicae]
MYRTQRVGCRDTTPSYNPHHTTPQSQSRSCHSNDDHDEHDDRTRRRFVPTISGRAAARTLMEMGSFSRACPLWKIPWNIGENIADNGGIKEAYVAYTSCGSSETDPSLARADLLDFGGRFLVRHRKHRVAQTQHLHGRSRSTSRFRVIGLLSNVPDFAKDLKCLLGSKMNPHVFLSAFSVHTYLYISARAASRDNTNKELPRESPEILFTPRLQSFGDQQQQQQAVGLVCCPGWTQVTRLSFGCNKPLCSVACQNGGVCSSPNRCACPRGFTGSYCQTDIDECVSEKPCDQICINTAGSYECYCRSGYNLQADRQSCRRNVTEDDDDVVALEARDLIGDFGKDSTTTARRPLLRGKYLTTISPRRKFRGQVLAKSKKRDAEAGEIVTKIAAAINSIDEIRRSVQDMLLAGCGLWDGTIPLEAVSLSIHLDRHNIKADYYSQPYYIPKAINHLFKVKEEFTRKPHNIKDPEAVRTAYDDARRMMDTRRLFPMRELKNYECNRFYGGLFIPGGIGATVGLFTQFMRPIVKSFAQGEKKRAIGTISNGGYGTARVLNGVKITIGRTEDCSNCCWRTERSKFGNNRRETPLHTMGRNYYGSHLEEKFFPICESHTVRLDVDDDRGNTPLRLALTHHNEKMVDLLIRRGADPDLNVGGSTALHVIGKTDEHDESAKMLFIKICDEINRTVEV